MSIAAQREERIKLVARVMIAREHLEECERTDSSLIELAVARNRFKQLSYALAVLSTQ